MMNENTKTNEIRTGDEVVTPTGKRGKVVWQRKPPVLGLPSYVVSFADGTKAEYTPDQFGKVFGKW